MEPARDEPALRQEPRVRLGQLFLEVPRKGLRQVRRARHTVQLADIQKQPIKSYKKRNIPFFIDCYGEEASASVEFDAADASCPVFRLEKLIENGYTFIFGEHESYMPKAGVRVKMLVLRVRNGLKDNLDMNTPASTRVPADGPGPLQGREATREGAREVRRCLGARVKQGCEHTS